MGSLRRPAPVLRRPRPPAQGTGVPAPPNPLTMARTMGSTISSASASRPNSASNATAPRKVRATPAAGGSPPLAQRLEPLRQGLGGARQRRLPALPQRLALQGLAHHDAHRWHRAVRGAVERPADVPQQSLERVGLVGRRQPAERGEEAAFLDQGLQQPFLGTEVVEHQARRHACSSGDRARRGGVEAALGEELLGRVEQAAPGYGGGPVDPRPAGLAADGTFPRGGRRRAVETARRILFIVVSCVFARSPLRRGASSPGAYASRSPRPTRGPGRRPARRRSTHSTQRRRRGRSPGSTGRRTSTPRTGR